MKLRDVAMNKTLVLGYGNALRSDDGIGIEVAERIAGLNLHDVDVRTCHQLQIELVPDLAHYTRVIFVDASVGGEHLCIRKISSASHAPASSSHSFNPESLYEFLKGLFHIDVEMFVCTIRGKNFSLGTSFSSEALEYAEEAVRSIVSIIEEEKPSCVG